MYVLTEKGSSSSVVSVKINYLITQGQKIYHLFFRKFKIGKANQFTTSLRDKQPYCGPGIQYMTKQLGEEMLNNYSKTNISLLNFVLLISDSLKSRNSYYWFGMKPYFQHFSNQFLAQLQKMYRKYQHAENRIVIYSSIKSYTLYTV